MEKVKPPRDTSRLKSKIVSRIINFTKTMGFGCICMIFATGIFWLVGIRETKQDYAGYWIALVVLFAVLPQIVFRVILKYRDIPKGYTLEQAQARWKLDEISKNLRGASRGSDWKPLFKIIGIVVVFGLGVIVYLNIAMLLIGFVKNDVVKTVLATAVVGSIIVAPIISAKLFYHKTSPNNAESIYNAVIDVRYGRHYKKWILAFGAIGFGVPIIIFAVNVLWFIPIYVVLMIFLGKKAGAKINFKIRL